MYHEPVEIQKITLNKFCQVIEELINELVNESVALDWDEDYLTRAFLLQLRIRLDGSQIVDLENRVVFLTPYKLGKTVEKKFGDIGVIVRINYGDGDQVEGIAFLEAKRKYKVSRNFDALKWEQLERIYGNAPHSQLLLYDFRDISEFASTGLVAKKNATASSPMTQLPVTKFVTVPINKAIQVKQKNERLYKLSLPLSYQLGYRYMNGFDLDFNHGVLSTVKSDFEANFNASELEIPKYLIYIDIVPESVAKVENIDQSKGKKIFGKPPNTEINGDLYGPISS